jgi:hypothetical protein
MMNGGRSRARGFVIAITALVSWGLVGGFFAETAAQPKPEGEMRWTLYVTLPPVWFDPGEVVGAITPFWVLYAMHDALVKAMPGKLPSWEGVAALSTTLLVLNGVVIAAGSWALGGNLLGRAGGGRT